MNELATNLFGLSGVFVDRQKIYGYFQGKRGLALLLLNGSPIEDLSGISPKSLTGVQIIKGGVAAANMASGLMMSADSNFYGQSTKFGIVFVTSSGGNLGAGKLNRPLGFMEHKILGYTSEQEFYFPAYDKQKDLKKNDFRSTLFWKSHIVTDADGKAELEFYTSDEKGKYKIVLEGIGIDGQIIRDISYFEVK